MKNYDNFVINKKITEILSTTNEGWLLNVWQKLWEFLKKTFGGDVDTAWIKYMGYLQSKGYLSNNKGTVVQFYPYGDAAYRESKKDIDMIDRKMDLMDVEKQSSKNLLKPTNKLEIEENEDGTIVNPEIEELDTVKEAKTPLEHPDVNINNISMKELKERLKRRYEQRIKYSEQKKMFGTFVWGAPGLGKTEGVRQFCEEKELNLMVWNLATCEPSDFIGVPDIENVEGSKRTVNRPPIIFPPENIKTGGVLFLDEMNRANKAVLGAALTLCIDGRVGSYMLPKNWQVIAAGNRSIEADVEKIDSALGNRFAHVNLVTTVDEWVEDWAISKPWMHPDILAFVAINPDFFHHFDTEIETEAWPSPRNWEICSMEYTEEMKKHGGKLSKPEIVNIVGDYVGTGVARTFAEFCDIKDEFTKKDMEQVYTEPDKAKLIKKDLRLDRQKAIVHFICFFKRDKQLEIDEIKNVFKYALRMENFEMATLMINLFKKIHPYILSNETYKKEFMKLVKDWHTKYKKDLDISDE